MVPTTCGVGSGKDQGSSGSRGEGKGAKREQRGVKRAKVGSPPPVGQGQGRIKGVKGSKGSKVEQTESKGSKSISILGFRVPTTCGGKYFDDHI